MSECLLRPLTGACRCRHKDPTIWIACLSLVCGPFHGGCAICLTSSFSAALIFFFKTPYMCVIAQLAPRMWTGCLSTANASRCVYRMFWTRRSQSNSPMAASLMSTKAAMHIALLDGASSRCVHRRMSCLLRAPADVRAGGSPGTSISV